MRATRRTATWAWVVAGVVVICWLPGAWSATSPALRLQHAVTPSSILETCHANLGQLKTGHISSALGRIARLCLSDVYAGDLEGIRGDGRLREAFTAAVERGLQDGERRRTNTQHLASLVLACGIMGLGGGDGDSPDSEFATSLRHAVLELDSRAASLEDHEISSVTWALEGLSQIGSFVGPHLAPRIEDRLVSLNLPFRVLQGFLPGMTLQESSEGVEWGRDMIELGGGVSLQESRYTAWQSSNESLCFEYSGKRMPPKPFSPGVESARKALLERTGIDYDGVLLNLYPHGKCGMRYHVDPGVGVDWTSHTAVISAGGSARMFIMRKMDDHSIRHAYWVRPGDVVYMFDDCQERFQHCIRVERSERDAGPRMSMVFKQSLS